MNAGGPLAQHLRDTIPGDVVTLYQDGHSRVGLGGLCYHGLGCKLRSFLTHYHEVEFIAQEAGSSFLVRFQAMNFKSVLLKDSRIMPQVPEILVNEEQPSLRSAGR